MGAVKRSDVSSLHNSIGIDHSYEAIGVKRGADRLPTHGSGTLPSRI
jgi:hypothetical protein